MIALAPTRAPAHPDEVLVGLGLGFNRLRAEYELHGLEEGTAEGERTARWRPLWALVERITDTPARTLAGVEVKARVALWLWLAEHDEDEGAATDERLATQVMRGVLQLAGP